MQISVIGKNVETNVQGFLMERSDWSEDFASEIAQRDGIDLYKDHWDLIWYFRDFFEQNQKNPTMRHMVRSLGKVKGEHINNKKAYEKHVYSLFPQIQFMNYVNWQVCPCRSQTPDAICQPALSRYQVYPAWDGPLFVAQKVGCCCMWRHKSIFLASHGLPQRVAGR